MIFWRYKIENIKEIFKDIEIIKIEKDPEAPGVFLKKQENLKNALNRLIYPKFVYIQLF
jgi:hypothetical protein